MNKMEKTVLKYWKGYLKTLKDSTKIINRGIYKIITLDFLAYFLIYIAVLIASSLIYRQVLALEQLDFSAEGILGNIENVKQMPLKLKSFYSTIIWSGVGGFLIIVLGWSLFKGIIYNMLLKKRFTKRFYYKFSLLNLIWFVFWIIVLLLIILIFKNTIWPSLFYLFLLFALYLGIILYVNFVDKQDIKDCIKKAFHFGITKIKYFLLPLLTIFVIFIILSFILNITTMLPLAISAIIVVIALLIFIAWSRHYLCRLLFLRFLYS